jgi:hypothetical protein
MGWERNAGEHMEGDEGTKWIKAQEWKQGSSFDFKETEEGRRKVMMIGQTGDGKEIPERDGRRYTCERDGGKEERNDYPHQIEWVM